MFDFLDPYSVQGLRKRASKLNECPYKLILGLAADQLEAKVVNKKQVKKAIEYVRTGHSTLLSVAIKMLNPNQGQIDTALHLLKKMEWEKTNDE